MLDRAAIMDVLAGIPDPEMPIGIVDLGLVEDVRLSDHRHGNDEAGAFAVDVDLLPTFVGCPALDMIADEVRTKLGALPGVAVVNVHWRFDPPWSVDRITPAGRASLKEHGVSVPDRGSDQCCAEKPRTVTLRTSAVPCPFCGSTSTNLESSFGPTRCRMIYYCNACRNSFEHLKRL